jgi:hypothetical protein
MWKKSKAPLNKAIDNSYLSPFSDIALICCNISTLLPLGFSSPFIDSRREEPRQKSLEEEMCIEEVQAREVPERKDPLRGVKLFALNCGVFRLATLDANTLLCSEK